MNNFKTLVISEGLVNNIKRTDGTLVWQSDSDCIMFSADNSLRYMQKILYGME